MPESIMPTELAIPRSNLTWPDHYFHIGALSPSMCNNSGLAMHTRLELGMADCVACCISIILSGLQYRFSSCRGGDEDINHDDVDL